MTTFYIIPSLLNFKILYQKSVWFFSHQTDFSSNILFLKLHISLKISKIKAFRRPKRIAWLATIYIPCLILERIHVFLEKNLSDTYVLVFKQSVYIYYFTNKAIHIHYLTFLSHIESNHKCHCLKKIKSLYNY